MRVNELLDQLEQLNIVVIVNGPNLIVRGDLTSLSDELRQELREMKPAILKASPVPRCICTVNVACLSHRDDGMRVAPRPSPEVTPEEHRRRTDRLVSELQTAQTWLEQADVRLGDDMWSDPKLAGQICVVIAEWQIKEKLLRGYRFRGCIWGEGETCPTDAVEKCMACRPTGPSPWQRTPDGHEPDWNGGER